MNEETGLYDPPISQVTEIKRDKCDHIFERKQFSAIECRKCGMGLIDGNRFILKDGKIVGVK